MFIYALSNANPVTSNNLVIYIENFIICRPIFYVEHDLKYCL